MNCRFRMNNFDNNTCNDSINRTRYGGSAVPLKVTGKYIYTQQKVLLANAKNYNGGVLMIYDYYNKNDAEYFQTNLLNIQNNVVFDYDQNKVNMNLYDNKAHPEGMIFLQPIKEKKTIIDDLDASKTTDIIIYYDGSDLTVSNYSVIILCTKLYPFFASDGENIDINEYNLLFGYNLQKYINLGGNVILAGGVWQNDSIPNFFYSSIPFPYRSNYIYGFEDIDSIKILNPSHPVMKQCSNILKLTPLQSSVSYPNRTQNIVSNIVITPDSTLLATTNKNVPFIAVYRQPLTGSRIVVINAYIFEKSAGVHLELAKMIYNSIFWCIKINQ